MRRSLAQHRSAVALMLFTLASLQSTNGLSSDSPISVLPKTLGGEDLHLIDCDDESSNLIGLSQTKCKPRTGPAKISGSEEFATILEDLLKNVLGKDQGGGGSGGSGDSEISEFRDHLFSTYQQMNYVKQSMQENQNEIDEVAQHWLPILQRHSVVHERAAEDLRTKATIATAQMRQISQGVPRGMIAEAQHRHVQTMETLYSLRSDILAAQKASQKSTDEEILLSTAISTKAVHKALQQDDAADETWLGVVQFLEQQQSFGLHDKVISALDQLIEGYKELRRIDREELTEQRADWSKDLDNLNEYLEELLMAANHHQTTAYETLLESQKFKSYLKHLTSQQFKLLEWHNLLHTHLAEFGKHFDLSQRLEALTIPLFHDLVALFKTGEVSNPPYVLNGCDGSGGKADSCGVCNGDNSTCIACNGILNDSAVLDVCGVCGDGQAHDCRYFCDGTPNSGRTEDLCGVCDGKDRMCAGCDGLPFSTRTFDLCGVCGGDGGSCGAQRNCTSAALVCPNPVKCPFGKVVTATGFASCCFDPEKDCVTIPLSN